jgi:hypothetical protein
MYVERHGDFWIRKGTRCWWVYRDGGERQFGPLQAIVRKKSEALALCA